MAGWRLEGITANLHWQCTITIILLLHLSKDISWWAPHAVHMMPWLPTQIKLVHSQRNISLLIFSLSLSDELPAAIKIPRLMLKLFPHNTFTHMWKMLCGNTVNPQLSSTNAICCWSSTLCDRNLKYFQSHESWRLKWTFCPFPILLCCG